MPNVMDRAQNSEELIGLMPDYELRILPRWLFFDATNGYQCAQYTHFHLENRDDATIVFRFRTKDRRLFMFSVSHGFIAPKASLKVTAVLTEYGSWLRDISDTVGKVHKVVVENMIVHPEFKIPKDPKQQKLSSRLMFSNTRRRTGNRGELNIYTKMHIFLPNYEDSTEDTD